MDELIEPALTGMAVETQQREMFGLFVDSTFHGLYHSWSTRVDINWMDFLRYHLESASATLTWTIRSLSTLYIGRCHHDPDKIACSRSMYGRALHCLMSTMRNPNKAKSDATLGAALLLGVYEMLDGTKRLSWLAHSSGVSTLIRLRGPSAHRRGFGRTLLISFRAFLVADAFIRNEPCFLEESEWRSIMEGWIADEKRSSRRSLLGETVDQAFNEIVVCPGLLARTRSMLACSGLCDPETLLFQSSRCQNSLKQLNHQLKALLCVLDEHPGLDEKPEIIGPIPFNVAITLAKNSLCGTRLAIEFLDQLLLVLQANQSRWLDCSGRMLMDQIGDSRNMSSDVVAVPVTGAEPDNNVSDFVYHHLYQKPAQPSLDNIALSMGMLAVEFKDCRNGVDAQTERS
ncbi:uncharacterized protein ATNIH1004_005195 [Aspergillus tanneri]|uniref:Transcription factor domain-containing protein n=1 Tax=Aspergillus tanneri TaxID=1220188 RepID=A0A5M9MV74_9EURO|nr:uncharacterized protein ATNIH1004_005195 [Aspergillus tanneri]KAA8649294.1 hypothetical protein ATNIH1004_005195 [Aspergillus tanneri]